MSDKRTSFLDQLLGRNKAEGAIDALEGLRQRLDDAKVARKEYEPMLKRIKRKGIMEDLKTEISSALSIVRDDVSDEVVNKVVASALGLLLSEESDAPEDVVEEDVIEEEIMEDDEEMIDEEIMSKELTVKIGELVDINKALLNERDGIHDDLFAVAKEAVGALKGMSELSQRLDKIEKQVNARPRRASEASSTVLDEDGVKKIKSNIDKGLQETDKFWS